MTGAYDMDNDQAMIHTSVFFYHHDLWEISESNIVH